MKIKINILESLERKGRAAIKNLPEFRRLEREKLAVEKGVASGKYSRQQGVDLKSLLRARRERLLNRVLYRMLKAPAQTA
jgi:hypothetical protein